MRRLVVFTAVLLTTCTPFFAHASILISEVAWMGTSENANAEWIELYNNGDSEDVTGWTLTATDGQPSITLSGTIGANSYVLLERTSDASVPTVSAFLLYSGALGNTGEILELRNENGTLITSVDGSHDWSIGGDNATKETLQRRGEPAVGSWFTGAPTPMCGSQSSGTQSAGTGDSVEETHSTRSALGNVIYGTKDENEEKIRLEPALVLDVGDDEQTVTKGVPTDFEAHAYKENGKEIVIKDVEWNFGDGTVLNGRSVRHAFAYTGDYLVSVTGRRTGFLQEVTDTARLVAHVVEPAVVLHSANSEFIELENRSNELVNLSGFVLVSGNTNFRIPENTLILPEAHVRLPSKTTHMFNQGDIHLFNPGGVLMSTYGEAPVPVKRKVSTNTQSIRSPTPTEQEVSQETFTEKVVEEFVPTANAYVASSQSERSGVDVWWWILGLVTVIGIAIVAVILLRQERQQVVNGFVIDNDLDDLIR